METGATRTDWDAPSPSKSASASATTSPTAVSMYSVRSATSSISSSDGKYALLPSGCITGTGAKTPTRYGVESAGSFLRANGIVHRSVESGRDQVLKPSV